MTERMTPADVASLHRESRTAPQHVGSLAVFEPPAGGFAYERLVRLIEERISLAPRYRQKVREIPGRLGYPVWLDDPHFDITYHVRRSALPRPGTDEQLLEFCARIQSRLLDRGHPLWEMYLVEGLSGGRVAIITKTHEAMVGEPDGIDLAQVILDAAPTPRRTVEAVWMPHAEPGGLTLVRDAVLDGLRRPAQTAALLRQAIRDTQQTASRVASVAEGLTSSALASVRRGTASPLHARIGEQRRIAIARTTLGDYRTVRAAFGGTVNEVVLAVVAGALRGWLVFRAQPLPAGAVVRALLPVGVIDPVDTARGHVHPLLVDLPVGEPDPVVRLAQLRYEMASHQTSGRAMGADRIAGLHGFAPPTLHALGVRAASGLARRMYSLVVTNMPGPQLPLYAAGARMTEMFPVLPLTEGQTLSIGLTSYNGGVYFGLNGDRDAARDISTVADLIEESLAELVTAATSSRGTLRPSTVGRPRRAHPDAPSTRNDRP